MKKPRKPLHKQEKGILQTLYKGRRLMSIKEVAEKTGISWITAKKYLGSLEEKKWMKKNPLFGNEKSNRVRYRFDLERLLKMRKERKK